MQPTPTVRTIDLQNPPPAMARLLIAQARWDIGDFERRDGLYFFRNVDVARQFVDRILGQARQHLVNLVVFPELSVPESLIATLQDFSKKTGAVVVGGSHYFKSKSGYHSRSPIVIDGTVYFTEKTVPAPSESITIEGQGLHPGTTLHLFRNTPVGTFAVLICSDYLDDVTRHLIPIDDLDLLCVPTFQRDSVKHHLRMHIDCESSADGLYIAYANTICPGYGDGRSALFAHMDTTFLANYKESHYTDGNPQWKICELADDQTYMIVDVDLRHKRPYAGKTVRARTNVHLFQVGGEAEKEDDEFARVIGNQDDRYIRIKELFVAPREYDALKQKLEASKIVFIVGDPGIGKTYTAARLLRDYFDQGFHPTWYGGLERPERLNQRQILDNFNPGGKQIFYFEEPFGRTTYESRDTLPRIFGPLLDRLEDREARVVITSRREVFDQFRRAASLDLAKYTEEMNVVKPSYSVDALTAILHKLGDTAAWYDLPECRQIVWSEIELGHLATPLAIRDFIFSTESVDSPRALSERLARRRAEQKTSFSEEILASGTRTQLALAAVFLFGSQPVPVLEEWFMNVAAFIDPRPETPRTFTDEMRTQMGYRIEQYGTLATVLRFTHPLYEEAFVSACQANAQMSEVLHSMLTHVTRTSIQTAVAGVLRYSTKYPELCRHLLDALIPLIQPSADLLELSQLGLRILTLQRRTADKYYLDLLVKICSLDELAARINGETDLNALALGFRYLEHFGRRLEDSGRKSRRWRSEVAMNLAWNVIFDRWRTAPSLSKVMEALESASSVSSQKTVEFLKSFDEEQFTAKFRLLPEPEQEHFLKFAGPALPPSMRVTRVPTSRRDRVHLWLNGARAHTRGLVVDRGAVRAIGKGYSLLPVGIRQVIGDFWRGEAISIFDEDMRIIAGAVVSYSSEEIRLIRGQHSSLINKNVADDHSRAVVQWNRLVLVEQA